MLSLATHSYSNNGQNLPSIAPNFPVVLVTLTGGKSLVTSKPTCSAQISLCQKVKNIWASIQNFFINIYNKIRRTSEYEETQRYINIVSTAGSAAVAISKLNTHITNILPKSTSKSDGGFFGLSSEVVTRIGGQFKIGGGAISGLSGLVGFISSIRDIANESARGRTRETTDASLRLVESVSTMGASISSITQGLSMVQAIDVAALAWATPLGITSAALSVASLVLNVRGLIQTKEVRDVLDLPQDQALQKIKEELENTKTGDGIYYATRYFDIVRREKYSAQILHIINSDSNPETYDAAIQKDQKATVKAELHKALKSRVDDKIVSHKIAIIAAVICLVAVLTLFCPFGGPIFMAIGLALLGSSSALSLGKFIYDHLSIKKLVVKLDQLCDFNAIPDHKMPAFARCLSQTMKQQKSPAKALKI